MGRVPSHFRWLLIGYFEGLDAERAIARRAADPFALREFLGLGVAGGFLAQECLMRRALDLPSGPYRRARIRFSHCNASASARGMGRYAMPLHPNRETRRIVLGLSLEFSTLICLGFTSTRVTHPLRLDATIDAFLAKVS